MNSNTPINSKNHNNPTNAILLWASVLFIAALLPRLYQLGTFLTIDELKWAEGAAQFLAGLRSGDLFLTYWHFHPGTTVTWGSALLLWGACFSASDVAACATNYVEHLPEIIGWLRLSPVLITSFGVVGVYLLGQRWLGNIALLTAFLLAFDPFFIAHSRILNGDAGAAILMFLSLLAYLNYQHIPQPKGTFHSMLLLSGALAGLALSTKLPAPLIGLFIPAIALFFALRAELSLKSVQNWLLAMLVWGLTSLLIFFILWPALWVDPVETLRLMYVDAFEIGEVGKGHDTFFFGQITSDPGLWFYPYVITFRLTLVTFFGVVLTLFGLGWLLMRRRQEASSPIEEGAKKLVEPVLLMIGFIIFIVLFSAVSPKKLDRYVMAVIPAITLIAAIGFGIWVTMRSQQGQLFRLGLIVALQLFYVFGAAPYYLTFYNPLLGGVDQAAAQVPVGWGEGLEEAAAYLNQLPNAENLRVSSWYSDIFHPYFVGERVSFSDDGRAQLSADYVVFYVNQIQRQKPYAGLVDHFRQDPPVFALNVAQNGTSFVSEGEGEAATPAWVEVYKAPAAQSASGAPKLEGIAQLLAYKVVGERVNHTGRAIIPDDLAANQAEVTLFLRVIGPMPDDTNLGIFLITPEDEPVLEWTDFEILGHWLPDNIIEWQGRVELPQDFPPGDYRLAVIFKLENGQPMTRFDISEKDPIIQVK